MKRTPLLRKAWLKRSGKPMKRTRMARMSKKTKAKQPERRKCIAAVRERSGNSCEIQWDWKCDGAHDHTHEIIPRSKGGSIYDPSNAKATCFYCHRQVHRHPNEARRRGLLKDNLKST